MPAIYHYQRQSDRPGTVRSPPATVPRPKWIIYTLFQKHDGLTGVLICQLFYHRTGGLAYASGGTHKILKDDQARLCGGRFIRRQVTHRRLRHR